MGGEVGGVVGAEVEWQLVQRRATVSADTNESHDFMDVSVPRCVSTRGNGN
jgi:hypothetical protein